MSIFFLKKISLNLTKILFILIIKLIKGIKKEPFLYQNLNMLSVQKIFNNMAEEYDKISDLWYSWLFSRLHYLIASKILYKKKPMKVLDVGCGTGFQSYLYAIAGCEIYGIDIACDLIEKAKKKLQSFNSEKFELFTPYYDYVKRYNRQIKQIIQNNSSKDKYIPPKFLECNAINIQFDNEEFDHINCCGSTLSFIPRYKKAISEISRVLKKNGTFFIEVENRWNIGLIWYVIDPLFRGKFEYHHDFKTGLKILIRKPTRNIWIDYPFGDYDKSVNMKLKLFTTYSLKRTLLNYGLKVEKKWAIHSITNLIPSTLLDCSKPTQKIISRFKFLASLEEKLSFKMLGSSLVLFGHKI